MKNINFDFLVGLSNLTTTIINPNPTPIQVRPIDIRLIDTIPIESATEQWRKEELLQLEIFEKEVSKNVRIDDESFEQAYSFIVEQNEDAYSYKEKLKELTKKMASGDKEVYSKIRANINEKYSPSKYEDTQYKLKIKEENRKIEIKNEISKLEEYLKDLKDIDLELTKLAAISATVAAASFALSFFTAGAASGLGAVATIVSAALGVASAGINFQIIATDEKINGLKKALTGLGAAIKVGTSLYSVVNSIFVLLEKTIGKFSLVIPGVGALISWATYFIKKYS